MNRVIKGIIFVIILLFIQSCGVVVKHSFYYEPTVNRQDVTIRRIAIVPNRLPLNITEPEKWRRYNNYKWNT